MIKKLRKGYSSIKICLLGTIGSMFWIISYLLSSSLFPFLDVLASFIFTFSIGSVLIGMCVYKIANFSKNINVFIFYLLGIISIAISYSLIYYWGLLNRGRDLIIGTEIIIGARIFEILGYIFISLCFRRFEAVTKIGLFSIAALFQLLVGIILAILFIDFTFFYFFEFSFLEFMLEQILYIISYFGILISNVLLLIAFFQIPKEIKRK